MHWLALMLVAACGNAEDKKAQAAFDHYRQPEKLVAALGLKPGDVVADVGAGTGYLTHRLAAAVGESGRVVATDIDAAALRRIQRARNLETRRVPPDDPSLEARAYDLILLSEVDHLLPERAAYLTRLQGALKPGGRIAVVNRRLYRAPLVEAAGRAGLQVAGEYDEIPAFFLVFLEKSK